MSQYDVAVVGAGPGGYVAAIRSAQLGARTIVIERDELGGVCLNRGCIPTKTFIHTAELLRKMGRAGEFGLKVDGFSLDMAALLKRKNAIIRRNRGGIEALFKAHGIECVKGDARVVERGSLAADGQTIAAKAIIVASGSSPAQIPGLETDGKRIITSTEALELKQVPKRAVVVGAGALGAEFACIWNAFGSQVTLVEMLPRVLPNEDEEISTLFAKSLQAKGIDIRTATKVSQLDGGKSGVHVQFEGAHTSPVDADVVLIGIGRRFHSEAVSDSPGLGVQTAKNGAIAVDERMETSVPGIYAVGDVVGKTLLAHGASAEGLVAAANACGKHAKMDYRVVPACTYTSPEVASVGMTEAVAREAGIEPKVGRFHFAASGRAAAMGETEGMVKIVGDGATDELIGLHIMGAEAGEMIASAAVAMTMEATVAEVAHTIHAHPTLSEAVMEAAEDYLGMGIHTPPRK